MITRARLSNRVQHDLQHSAPKAMGAVLRPVRRAALHMQAASDVSISAPEPVIYAKAFVSVLTRHAAELALNWAAEVNMAIAEQPKRFREFQEEVQVVAEREQQRSSSQPGLLTATSSSSSSSRSSSSLAASRTSVDLEAVVDELRADIAAARSLIQQIRLEQQQSSGSSR